MNAKFFVGHGSYVGQSSKISLRCRGIPLFDRPYLEVKCVCITCIRGFVSLLVAQVADMSHDRVAYASVT